MTAITARMGRVFIDGAEIPDQAQRDLIALFEREGAIDAASEVIKARIAAGQQSRIMKETR